MPINDLESWMWAEACAMLDRADRLHRQFIRPKSMQLKVSTWEPPVDVYATIQGYKILVALPGVVPEHVKVKLDGGHLLIVAKRHLLINAETAVRRVEIPYGRFERNIELPEGQFEIGSKEFVNGCLAITLRKT